MADDGSAIRISNIEDADFTVNRYTVEGGEVVEQEVEANISDEDIAAIGEEIEGAMEEALDDFERTGEVPTERTTAVEAETEAGTTTATSQTDDTEDAGSGGDDGADTTMAAAMATARRVVQANDITKTNWPTFASLMRDEGVSDQELLSDVWSKLREQDELVEEDDESDDSGGADGGESGDQGDGSEDASDGADSGAETPTPEELDAMGMEAVLEDADAAFLAIEPGDEDSDEAIDLFDEQIRSGDIETLNVQTSVNADEILSDAGVPEDEIPEVILQFGDDYEALTGDETIEMGSDMEVDETDDDGGSGGSPERDPDITTATPDDIPEVELEDILLLVQQGNEASEKVIEALLEPISEGIINAVPVGSEAGAALVDELSEGAAVPLPVEAVDGGFAVRDLEAVISEYA